jgi:hypothetical protein
VTRTLPLYEESEEIWRENTFRGTFFNGQDLNTPIASFIDSDNDTRKSNDAVGNDGQQLGGGNVDLGLGIGYERGYGRVSRYLDAAVSLLFQ